MTPYKYNALERDEIRLLELLPSNEGDGVAVRLHRFRLPEEAEPRRSHRVLLTREDGFDVPNAPSYEALSYTWGEASTSHHSLQLWEGDNVSDMDIRPNLDEALRRLRRDIAPHSSRFLWIDAVCINQEDVHEKSSQIPKMAMIYNRADGVLVWLGEAREGSTRAVAFIHRLLNLDNFDPLTRDPGTTAEWAALIELMQRPWFSRRWIVQEISLARKATIYCGGDTVSWHDFAAAIALLVSRNSDLRKILQTQKNLEENPDCLIDVDALGAKILVDLTTNLFRRSEDGTVLERLLSLEALVSTMTAFKATKPHDTIYAVLWLANDAQPDANESAAMLEDQLLQTPQLSPQLDPAPSEDDLSDCGLKSEPLQVPSTITFRTAFPRKRRSSDQHGVLLEDVKSKHASLRPPLTGHVLSFSGRSASDRSLVYVEKHFADSPGSITVDYSKSVFEVCRQFLEFTIKRSKTIDVLLFPWVPELPSTEEKLPSWMPQHPEVPHSQKSEKRAPGRTHADPLVGAPGHGRRNYNASGRTKTYPSRDFIGGRTMTVTGFVLDHIGEMGAVAAEGRIPGSWWDLMTWTSSPNPVPDKFWRTLVADRGHDGKSYPPPYFPLACKWMLEQTGVGSDVDTKELLAQRSCPSIAAEFIRRTQSVVWGRRLILTQGRRGSREHLGLVPANAEKGDRICILYGCSVPVVLRKVRNSETSFTNGKDSPRLCGSTAPELLACRLLMPPSERPGFGDENAERVAKAQIREPAERPVDSTPARPFLAPGAAISLKHASSGVRKALEREQEKPSAPAGLSINIENESQYVVIGECYLHGLMDGEAFKHQKEHGNKLRKFSLV